MIREQRFYDTSDFTAERLKQVGENYVAEQPEDSDPRDDAFLEIPADVDGWAE